MRVQAEQFEEERQVLVDSGVFEEGLEVRGQEEFPLGSPRSSTS